MFTFLRGSCRIPHVYTHVHMYTHVNQKQYSLNCKHSCLHSQKGLSEKVINIMFIVEWFEKFKRNLTLKCKGVPEPSQRWPPTRKRKEIQK